MLVSLLYGATVSLYNMGGVLISSGVAVSDSLMLPIAGQPHGSYIVVVNLGGKQYVYKVLL